MLILAIILPLLVQQTATAGHPWPVDFAAGRCDFERALALLDQMEADVADPWERGLMRARLLLQLERPKDVLSVLAKLPKPITKEQRAALAFVSGMAHGLGKNLGRALHALDNAQELGVDAPLVDGARGMAYLAAGKAAEAEQALLRALKSDPVLTGALYNLASLRATQGRVAEAGDLLRKAWHLGYKDPKKLKNDPALAPLRSAGLIRDLIESDEARCAAW